MEKLKIGFIGLGIMGKPMARNIIKAGYSTTVYNRSKPPLEEFAKQGIPIAVSPSEVAEKSDVTITIVSDSADVEQVILGSHGVIEGAKPDSVVIDMSSINPGVTRKIAAALIQKNIHMLDAPVSGGEQGAVQGTLAIMVGGDMNIFNRCKPILETMGKSVTLVGDNGAGHVVKLCNQIVGSTAMTAICEALVLCAKNGVDPEKMVAAISGGAAGSWQLEHRSPDMIHRRFKPGFFSRLMLKDLSNVLSNAREVGAPLPLSSIVQQLFTSVCSKGKGDLDYIAVLQVLEELAGLKSI